MTDNPQNQNHQENNEDQEMREQHIEANTDTNNINNDNNSHQDANHENESKNSSKTKSDNNVQAQNQEDTQQENSENSNENELNDLEELVNKYKDELQRERAEFINYRKRVVQEKADMENSIMGKILDSMLPALDSFDQLFSSSQNKKEQTLENFLKGAELIEKQLVNVFQKYGVEEFNPKGKPFEPGSMEALHLNETDQVNEDTVDEVYQKGYKINGRLLRVARVSVLKPKNKVDSFEDDQQKQ